MHEMKGVLDHSSALQIEPHSFIGCGSNQLPQYHRAADIYELGLDDVALEAAHTRKTVSPRQLAR